MNLTRQTHVAGALLAGFLFAPGSGAQPQPDARLATGVHHHYQLIDLGTFGGPTSEVGTEPTLNVINSVGTIVGGADTALPTPEPGCYNPIENPDCFIFHAFRWSAHHLTDLGTLPGGNYSWALAINEPGVMTGVSETNQVDPAAGNPEFHAVLWGATGKIRDLGTLGGTASFAQALNNQAQIIGNSLNAVPDPLSILATGGGLTLTETHGFLWENGSMRDLGTLGGPDSWAEFVNNRGQVAGGSYTSDVVDPDTGTPQIDLFLWQNGQMRDLGTLGGNNGLLGAPGIVAGMNDWGEITGTMMLAGDQFARAFLWDGGRLRDLGGIGGNASAAAAISQSGEVVGVATLPPDDSTNDAFLWRNGVMIDLGTLGGDPCSAALSLNSVGQVVGASESAAGGCNAWTAAFLWENGGPMVDLNSLVAPGSGVQLGVAVAINDAGEIVAQGAPSGCSVLELDSCQHVYALIPCDEAHPGIDACDYGLVAGVTEPTLPHRERAGAGSGQRLSATEARTRFLSVARARNHRYPAWVRH